MRNIISKIIPYIFMGMMIVIFVAGIILFSYLLIFGAVVGLILFVINWLKNMIVKKNTEMEVKKTQKTGRTIDHKDL